MSQGKWWVSALGTVVLLLAGYTVSTSDNSSDDAASTSNTTTTRLSTSTSSPASTSAKNRKSPDSAGKSGVATCEQIPEEAEDVVEDIERGGPFDYPANDGSHFGNYERLLPSQSYNYYREYTVTTPGTRSRGERRIVTGGGTERDPVVWYYTDDHYESFCEIPGL